MENCSKIWRCDVPTKATVLAWRALINKLPTRGVLARRGIVTTDHETCCVLCFTETINHLLCSCTISQGIWESIVRWMEVPFLGAQDINTHFLRFGLLLKGRKLKAAKHIIWMATIWAIWQARNRVLFLRGCCKQSFCSKLH